MRLADQRPCDAWRRAAQGSTKESVLTLPVLIQRTIITEVKYSMGGALAAVLLVSVLIINIMSVVLYRRMRLARGVIA